MVIIPILGIIGSFVAFIPFVGMIIHWALFVLMIFFVFIVLAAPTYIPNKTQESSIHNIKMVINLNRYLITSI